MPDQMRESFQKLAIAVQVLAGVVLLVSFRFPAVVILPDGSWGPNGPVSGLQCAYFAPVVLVGFPLGLIGALTDHSAKPHQFEQIVGALLVGFSGLTNFLLLTYVIAPRSWRFKLSLATCFCLAATIPGIVLSNMVPLTACYVWMGAALLVLSPQLVKLTKDDPEFR